MAETIGKRLKLAREAKNLTIKKVVQATRIRAHQIEAMEADDFDSMPSPVQARAFLKLYAGFLGLNLEELKSIQHTGIDDRSIIPAKNGSVPVNKSVHAGEPKSTLISLEVQNIGGNPNGVIAVVTPDVLHKKEKPKPPDPKGRINVGSVDQEKEENSSLIDKASSFPPENRPSQLKFNAIGMILRQRRESLSLTLDEIERHTHVRKHYLHALESGEFELLPSSVHARGMLSNFAHFLDLDVDELLIIFAEGLQIQRLERQQVQAENPSAQTLQYRISDTLSSKIAIPATIRRYLSIDIFVGISLVFLLLAFSIWGASRVINTRADFTPQPTARSISNILVSTLGIQTSTPNPQATGEVSGTVLPVAGETLALTLPGAGHGQVQVIVIAQQEAWVRVTVDGKVQFEGRVTAGAAYPFEGNRQIEVLTGNGWAISILYNQNNLGPLGILGQVVDRIYTANAILNPTATFTPTATIVPTSTVTLRPTATLRPSPTPRSSVTPRQPPTPDQ